MRRYSKLFASSIVLALSVAGCGGGGGGGGAKDDKQAADGGLTGTYAGAGTGCTVGVFNSDKYNAITRGMSREQVRALVGCKAIDLGTYSDQWLSEEEDRRAYLMVGFENDGAINKIYEEKLVSIPAGMTTPVAATCNNAEHITMAKYQAINYGMTKDEVNRLIGCYPSLTRALADANMVTGDTAYIWEYFIPGQKIAAAYINIVFDSDTQLVTSIIESGLF